MTGVGGRCTDGERTCAPLWYSAYKPGNPDYWRCYNNDKDCCDASEFGLCTSGSCYENPCQIFTGYSTKPSYTPPNAWYLYGCDFHNGLGCYLNGKDGNTGADRTMWNCFVNSALCSAECTFDAQRGTMVCPEGTCDLGCWDGSTFNETYQMCCKDNICCDNNSCYDYLDGTGRICGVSCNANIGFGQVCISGVCLDSCPAGFSRSFVSNENVAGCQKGDMVCIPNTSSICPVDSCGGSNRSFGARCYYDGVVCGDSCDWDGTNCQTTYLKECASNGACIVGEKMYEGCTCLTENVFSDSEGNQYCCAKGEFFYNGGCTRVNCPEGQEPDENGICRDVSG